MALHILERERDPERWMGSYGALFLSLEHLERRGATDRRPMRAPHGRGARGAPRGLASHRRAREKSRKARNPYDGSPWYGGSESGQREAAAVQGAKGTAAIAQPPPNRAPPVR